MKRSRAVLAGGTTASLIAAMAGAALVIGGILGLAVFPGPLRVTGSPQRAIVLPESPGLGAAARPPAVEIAAAAVRRHRRVTRGLPADPAPVRRLPGPSRAAGRLPAVAAVVGHAAPSSGPATRAPAPPALAAVAPGPVSPPALPSPQEAASAAAEQANGTAGSATGTAAAAVDQVLGTVPALPAVPPAA